MKPTDFSVLLTKFLSEHLSGQRNLSSNTILSYRDTFSLLITHTQSEYGVRPERVTLSFLSASVINGFLHWLENERNSGISTRNQRLAAIHSFFRYVQTERPDVMLGCQQILGIEMKKRQKTVVRHISEDELRKIFAGPGVSTAKGRRDLTMLCVLYDTGARVQELIDLKICDIRLDGRPIICLHGKGGKSRHVPIMKQTHALLSFYLKENNLLSKDKQLHPTFYNSRRQKLTCSGVSYILSKYAGIEDSRTITPHVFRHTKAMHLLQSNINLIHIRDFFGHSDITTTEIYARANTEMKRKAFERIDRSPVPSGLPAWHGDKDLMLWLKNLGK